MISGCEICNAMELDKINKMNAEKERLEREELEAKENTHTFCDIVLGDFIKNYALKYSCLPKLEFNVNAENNEIATPVIEYELYKHKKRKTKTVRITSWYPKYFTNWGTKTIHLPTLKNYLISNGFAIKSEKIFNFEYNYSSTQALCDSLYTIRGIIKIDFNCPKGE